MKTSTAQAQGLILVRASVFFKCFEVAGPQGCPRTRMSLEVSNLSTDPVDLAPMQALPVAWYARACAS